MADNKATPRQKMIGLMYLVLTALLALQIDNTVLDKFLFIDQSLKDFVSSSRSDNQKLFNGIEAAVEKRSNSESASIILDKARQVVEETNLVINEIEQLRNELIEVSGGINSEGKFVGAEEVDKVMTLTMGPADSQGGKGYRLKETLNNYAKSVTSIDDEIHINPLALDASQMELYKNTAQKNKDFVELNFDNTPLVAALAVLSQIETEVAKVESKALGILAEKVGADEFRVDRIEAMVSPESRVVTAGTPYKARLFIAASSSSSRPVMTTSVADVAVDESGIGNLEFIANASEFDERGRAKKVWTGSITLRTPSGDSTFTVQEEYEVARPSLQFRSKAIQALYYNCGNNIQVSVPELGNHFNPAVTAKGGEVIMGSGGNITVIPSGREVSLNVSSNGIYLGTEKFRVKPVPNPTLEVFSERGPLDLRKGGPMPKLLRIKAVPDQDFAEFLPLDARYKVTGGEIILVRNGIPRGTLKFNDDQVDLSALVANTQKGDRIIIDIKEVKRKNYKGNVEAVKTGVQVFSYEISK